MIIVTAPRRNHAAGVAQGVKQVFVQALVAEPTVERLAHQADKASKKLSYLSRLSGSATLG